jgi:hypothetical protein
LNKLSTAAPSGGQSPILEAEWTLDSYEVLEQVYNAGTQNERKSQRVRFKFIEVDVRKTTGDPWLFPVAEIYLPYADPRFSRGEDRWSHWSQSGRKLLGGEFELDQLLKKRQVWAQLPAKIRLPFNQLSEDRQAEETAKWESEEHKEGQALDQSWFTEDAPCWQIVSIEGVGPPSGNSSIAGVEDIYGYMADKAEGKDEQALYVELVQDPKVVRNPEIVGMITERRLVGFLEAGQLIKRDPDGTLRRVTG